MEEMGKWNCGNTHYPVKHKTPNTGLSVKPKNDLKISKPFTQTKTFN